MPATYELARKLADGPPIAIRLAKRALYHNQDVELRAALEFETFAQNVCRETEDARKASGPSSKRPALPGALSSWAPPPLLNGRAICHCKSWHPCHCGLLYCIVLFMPIVVLIGHSSWMANA